MQISKMLFKIAVICIALSLCLAAEASDQPSWGGFKKNFITLDGRVIDYEQGQASTSESQGYGMLLAVINGDRETFDSVWVWTKSNLAVRKDGLLAWLWGRRPNGTWEVMDYNNATDGDTLVAFALFKAAREWNRPDYKNEAMGIIRSIREKLAIIHEGRTFILPGYYGFANDDSVTMNPSYFIFPAFRLFAAEDDRKFWDKARSDGLELLNRSCFGTSCLPADWIRLSGGNIELDPKRPARFGYDAVRTLLYLSWEHEKMPRGLSRILDVYGRSGFIPQWIDLKSGETSKIRAHAGIYALYALAASRSGDLQRSEELLKEAGNLLQNEERNYYSYSLYLLSLVKDPL